jgi:hypothetical protein
MRFHVCRDLSKPPGSSLFSPSLGVFASLTVPLNCDVCLWVIEAGPGLGGMLKGILSPKTPMEDSEVAQVVVGVPG